MKSELFKDFGIPYNECEIEPRLDDFGVPRLFFRSEGNPLVGLDLTGASQLRQMLAHAGEVAQANEIDNHIEKVRRLTMPSDMRTDANDSSSAQKPGVFAGVEAKAGVGDFRPPPHGWMNSGADDAANQVPRMMADRQRRFIAATQSGVTEPILPTAPASPKPTASTVPITARSSVMAKGSATLSGDVTAAPITAQTPFVGRLSERPAEIRDAARNLVHAVEDQIHHMLASKPNDAESLVKQNEFIVFLEMVAAGLAKLADALDEAIHAGTNGSPEPVLLGKAGDIARQLGTDVTAWLEQNRTNLVDCTMRIGVFAASYVFLNACGVDGITASIVSGLVNASLPATTRKQ
jgi:hypothetical protein